MLAAASGTDVIVAAAVETEGTDASVDVVTTVDTGVGATVDAIVGASCVPDPGPPPTIDFTVLLASTVELCSS